MKPRAAGPAAGTVILAGSAEPRRGTKIEETDSVRNTVQHQEAFPQRTVRAPITRDELAESSYDTVFLIAELSDAIRRGVCYFSLGGRPLDDLNEVITALVHEGEIAYDDDLAEDPVGH